MFELTDKNRSRLGTAYESNVFECVDIGIPGLQKLFNDNCIKATSIVVEGPPGSGKTVFGIQFAQVSLVNGGEVIYINFFETLSEFLSKAESLGIDLQKYVNQGTLYYLHEYVFTEKEKLLFFIETILELIMNKKIKRIIIDTVDALTVALSKEEYRVFLQQVIQRIKSLGAVLLLLKETGKNSSFGYYPYLEEYMADVVIDLREEFLDSYVKRTLTIRKSKFTNYIPVHIEYEIGYGGIKVVFPDIHNLKGSYSTELLPTGIEELDRLLGGGIPSNSVVVFKGPSGTMKSLMALSFALTNAISNNKKILYISYKESINQISYVIKKLGYNPDLIKDKLKIVTINPIHVTPFMLEEIVYKMYDGDHKYDIRIDDGFEIVLEQLKPYKRRNLLLTLLSNSKNEGLTRVMIVNQSRPWFIDEYGLDSIADIIITTRFKEDGDLVKRQLAIIKGRGIDLYHTKFYDLIVKNMGATGYRIGLKPAE